MILIADGGSTKTSWALLSIDGVLKINTSGINPMVHTPELIQKVIREELLSVLYEEISKIDLLAFYGAGCNENGCRILTHELQTVFQCEISCSSDLAGSAIATIGDGEGIVSILGTGSNSGFYSKGVLKDHIPSLGYILGDEGSGSYLGKQLLADYLKKQMPANLAKHFEDSYHLHETDVIEAVYRKAKPNQYLASFVPFIVANSDEEYCKSLVKQAFSLFFQRNICEYKGYKNYPLAFTGSVAFGFRNFLEETATKYGTHISEILQDPVDGMINYFKKRL
ncbi:hypothetical protein [Saccharicrinis sp. FJH54]|uniref:hypothetical protein n=1 Tax=Saccharicrinis sp. FJH54 TaxID=3344665 RepID=UPI0035D4AEED